VDVSNLSVFEDSLETAMRTSLVAARWKCVGVGKVRFAIAERGGICYNTDDFKGSQNNKEAET
jgi:hypothetical protein